MTKQEYIQSLSRELSGFDEESRRDILMEIEDHIDELLRSHPEEDEASIVADLEKPEDLAHGLLNEAGLEGAASEEPGRERPEGKKGKTRITVDGEDLEDVIKRAMDLARLFKGSRLFREENLKGEKKDFQGEKRVRLEDIPLEGIRSLTVRSYAADIKILLSLGGLSVVAEGAEDSAFIVDDDEAGTLKIRTGARNREPDSIEIRVPSTVESLAVSSGSGDVTVIDRVGDLEVRTASGDIEIRSCSGNVKVDSGSGNISVSHCSEELQVRSASGDIRCEVDDLCSSVSVSSASGDVELGYGEDFSARFRWSTVSGSVRCDCEDAGLRSARTHEGLVPVEIGTVSGDIGIRLLRDS